MDPLHQFQIQRYLPINIGGLDASFSNSALYMVITVALITGLIVYGMRGRALVPSRMQSLAELFYEFVANLVRDNAGPDARKYFPFVFSLFMFIMVGNLIGLVPGSFTFTSHIIVTFGLALTVFVFVTLLGLIKHGFHFFSLFMPSGVPMALAPILIPIEILSYLSRPVSLSIRLFANMMAGHTMLKVFGGFSVLLGGALGGLGYTVGILPLVINIALVGFEILVAMLQAYVFTILTCLYIRDALELH
ncbi:F-type H+-transporting ATPase subunit a [Skermanella aerolata]|uniref:ATP synthase subunit a n=1 Tax=Skermanella aerolata TaxID=393310 RepID=A0A512DM37_9PROT|nr:F0F1 ATP synthase subunit A [Skermanella aerolata]KJB96366.1 F0F1 ATP synthase subunit A [Skermanella aerolata KACC 11604]GEO37533.1 ATP synthase subunit a [Skermanella aerolata]